MSELRTENEIIRTWNSLEPVISICCTTYNHESHLKETIQSFLMQETSFPFEIVIHDDASTDKTPQIILEYQKKYPSIIKVLFQSENQYKINGHLPFFNTWNAAQGKYIALCEGDDYWIDNQKLTKQLKLMVKLDTDICFTNAFLEYTDGERKKRFSGSSQGERICISDIIKGGGGSMPTASILIKSSILKVLPDWFSKAPVGDFFLQILGSERNGAAYLDDATSVYRVAISGSWSSRRSKTPKIKIESEAESYESILNGLRSEKILSEDIDYALSKELYYLSAMSIKIREFGLANILIRRSWKYYKFHSIKQFILYSSKFFWKYL